MKLYNNIALLVFVSMAVIVLSIVVIFDGKQNDSITGNNVVNTKVEVFPTVFKNCSFHLYPGWNMISFYCLGLFADRNTVLDSISNHYGAIFEYNSFDGSDPWKSYNPNLPNWTIQQLTRMNRVSGYWIYMYDDADFGYSGVYSNSVILLNDGWNLVGYPNTKTTNISDSLVGIPYSVVQHYVNYKLIPTCYGNITDNLTGNITANCTYNAISDTWLVNLNGGSSNTLQQFETYEGYWLNVSGTPQWLISR